MSSTPSISERSVGRGRVRLTPGEALRQQDALYRLTDQLQQARSRDAIYDAALTAILTALPCDRAAILLFDENRTMQFVAWSGLSERYRQAVAGHSPWSPDERNPAPVCIENLDTSELPAELKLVIRTEGIGAAAFIPLVADDKLLGKFMSYFDAPHSFHEDELGFSLNIARQLALALERECGKETLRASEQRFREMIDALPAAVYTTDAEGRITHYNPAAVEFSGRKPELGTDEWCISWKLYRPDGTPLPHAECPMAIALKEGRPIRGAEAIAERPDGSRRWFMPYPTPLRDATGRVVGGINMLVDITDSKRSEQALRDAGRRKDEFLAMLAHELRNPLAPIRNVSELLARKLAPDSKLQEPVAMIRRQTLQLTRLVDDLLDISRITAGRIELKPTFLEIATIIAHALETVKPMLDEKKHRVLVISSYRPLHVHGDFARLSQCLVNVLTNAAKYTDVGGEVRIQSRSEDGCVVVDIADSGAGISAELLPRIFDLFVQSDRTLDRAQGGLGIGLSVVKRLIEMHGGQISARSAGVGYGSTFEIRLPQITGPAHTGSEMLPIEVTPRRVLIVDDNVDAASSLALLLESEGHEARAVYNAKDALEGLESFQPQVCMLDIGLPDMDGYTLARHIRESSRFAGLKLIAITGYGQPDDVSRASDAGFDAHLVKPLDFSVLRRTMDALLEGQDRPTRGTSET
jgi:PAS domain S-box-containing protein